MLKDASGCPYSIYSIDGKQENRVQGSNSGIRIIPKRWLSPLNQYSVFSTFPKLCRSEIVGEIRVMYVKDEKIALSAPLHPVHNILKMESTRFFFISNSIFQLSLELLNTVFNIAENLRGPLLQIGVQTSFQSEFFHLAKENFENTLTFSTFC